MVSKARSQVGEPAFDENGIRYYGLFHPVQYTGDDRVQQSAIHLAIQLRQHGSFDPLSQLSIIG